MLLTHGSSDAVLPAVALTVGNFDGIHRGHQTMLERLRAGAGKRGLASCVLTFEPHPREFFSPRAAPTRLTSLREKLELLAAHGVERVHVQRFSRSFAALAPEAFVEQVLAKRLRARWLLIGEDFRFGAKRVGDLALLKTLGDCYGYEVETMPTVMHAGSRVSSSAVRTALAAGDLAAAETLLARTYSISGRVVHGRKLGRELGFATANVQLKHNRHPLTGIYAAKVHGIGAGARPAVASLGVRPTITASGRAVLEVHVFDFSGDLYAAHLRVALLHKIRDEGKYPDLETLEVQIEKTYGKNIPVEKTLCLARAYAAEQIERQKKDFQRLGVLGDWDNAYTTMAFKSEADEIRTLGKVLEKGYIYRGLKPVNWCFDCGSALAEAEVEYMDRIDFAVDVGFPLADDQRGKLARAFAFDELPKGPVYAVIWTTTPWTIPANQALNVHPDYLYSLVETEKGSLILANDLKEACLSRFGLKRRAQSSVFDHSAPGRALELINFRHPFYERLSPVYLGEYVTLEQGTGIVHSAPAYGVDDFISCRRYGLKDEQILAPVLGDGKYASSLPFFGGLDIWTANSRIVEKIREAGALFHSETHQHSYMHCWRHRTPIIYRATTQWFAGMDEVPGYKGTKPAETLRATALRGVEATRFYPSWGQARLRGMIANRPDWTLSRQRQWGVPMPFFIHRETGALHPRTVELLEAVAKKVEQGGIEAWQRIDARDLLGPESAQYEKVKDTLDVWFDSGSTHETVLKGSHAKQLKFPADLYLEGSDQHRGWFHSSLLVSCMLNGRAPYDALLTHGFVVDGDGRKMSNAR